MIAFYEKKSSPVSVWEGSRLNIAAHLHHHLELVLFLEGKSVAFADTERCELEPGDAFLTFPEQIHRYESHHKEHYFVLIVDPDLMPELSALFTGPLPESALLKGVAHDPVVLESAQRLLKMKNPQTVAEKAVQKGVTIKKMRLLEDKYELEAIDAQLQ